LSENVTNTEQIAIAVERLHSHIHNLPHDYYKVPKTHFHESPPRGQICTEFGTGVGVADLNTREKMVIG